MSLLVRPVPEGGYQGHPISTLPQVVLFDGSDRLARRVVSDFALQFRPGRPLAAIRDRFALFDVGEDVRHVSHTSVTTPSHVDLHGELLRLGALAPRGAHDQRDLGLGIGAGASLVHLIAFVNSDDDRKARKEFVQRCHRRLAAFDTAATVLWVSTTYQSFDFLKLRDLTADVDSVSRTVILPARLENVRQSEEQQVEMLSAILTDMAGSDLGTTPAWFVSDLFTPPARMKRPVNATGRGAGVLRRVEPTRPPLVVAAHTLSSGRSEADQYLEHSLSAFALQEFLLQPDAPIDEQASVELAERIGSQLKQAKDTFKQAVAADVEKHAEALLKHFDAQPLLRMSLADRAAVVRSLIRQARLPVTGLVSRFLASTQAEFVKENDRRLGREQVDALLNDRIGGSAGGIREATLAIRRALATLPQGEDLSDRPCPDFLPNESEADPTVGLRPAFAPTAPLVIWALTFMLFAARTIGLEAALIPLAGFAAWELNRFLQGVRSEREATSRPHRLVRAYLNAYTHWIKETWLARRQLQMLREMLAELEQARERWHYRCAEHQREAGVAQQPLTTAAWTSYRMTGVRCREEFDYLCRSVTPSAFRQQWASVLAQTVPGAAAFGRNMPDLQFGEVLRNCSAADLERVALFWSRAQLLNNWGPAPLNDGENDPGRFLSDLERFCIPPGARSGRILFSHDLRSPVAVEASSKRYRVVDRLDPERISVWLVSEWSEDREEEA